MRALRYPLEHLAEGRRQLALRTQPRAELVELALARQRAAQQQPGYLLERRLRRQLDDVVAAIAQAVALADARDRGLAGGYAAQSRRLPFRAHRCFPFLRVAFPPLPGARLSARVAPPASTAASRANNASSLR